MGTKQVKNYNDNNNLFLICPYCIEKIPIFELFIQNSLINIKLSCQCLEKKKNKKNIIIKGLFTEFKTN